MASARKRGRRQKPAQQRLDVVVGVRVTPDEAERLHSLARRNRSTLSQLTQSFYRRLLKADVPKNPLT